MEKIHNRLQKEGSAAASKAESRIKSAVKKPIKPEKDTHPGGRRPGDKK